MSDATSDLRNKDIQYSLHPYTHLAAHEEKGPLTIVRGENIYVWDSDGNRCIEGLAGLWCASLGFSDKRLVEAAHRQLDVLPCTHTFAHRSSPPVDHHQGPDQRPVRPPGTRLRRGPKSAAQRVKEGFYRLARREHLQSTTATLCFLAGRLTGARHCLRSAPCIGTLEML